MRRVLVTGAVGGMGAAIVARPFGRILPDALLPVTFPGPPDEAPGRAGLALAKHRKNGVKHG